MPIVTVIGGANIDMGGWPDKAARMGESNPGTVRMSPGGVGRNIAHNLAALGVETRLITAYGDDDHARLLRDSCRRLGIDDSLSPVFPGWRTSAYLFLTDGQGELALAVSDMDIYRRLTQELLAPCLSAVNGSDAVVIDANLPQESIAYLARHCTAPLFADPVSLAKCRRLAPVLGRIHTLKPNRLEAQALSGVTLCDESAFRRSAGVLLKKGVQRVLMSLGPEGVLAAEGNTVLRLPPLAVKVVNATGAGDAMMAAAVRAFLLRRSLEDTAREALAAACLALESPQTIHPGMSPQALSRKLASQQGA